MAAKDRPVVIRKVMEERGHGHHGGAWKVAYADFVTAMMAFFLLLWLLSTASEDTLKGLAEFFSDAQENRGQPGGVGGMLEGVTITPFEPVSPQTATPFTFQVSVPMVEEEREGEPRLELSFGDSPDPSTMEAGGLSDAAFEAERERRERQAFEQAKRAIEEALRRSPELAPFAENLVIWQTPEGLVIEIVDRVNAAMFPSGSDRMYPHMREILKAVVAAVAALPNPVRITGHTDATPFRGRRGYDNWDLSVDRALATRRALIELGLPERRIVEVSGKAAVEPFVPENPFDPRNRRISLLLLRTRPAAGAGQAADAGGSAPASLEHGGPVTDGGPGVHGHGDGAQTGGGTAVGDGPAPAGEEAAKPDPVDAILGLPR